MLKIAIIGAGIAGLTAARHLHHKADIQIFEKSWRAGGRMTSRDKTYAFDHGAQHFYVKTRPFKDFLSPFIKQGIIQRWDARFAEFDRDAIIARRQWNADFPHYVAVPGMNDFARVLAQDLNIQYSSRVTGIQAKDQRWELKTEDKSLGLFDWVILAIPAPQAMTIIPGCFKQIDQIRDKKMLACYSLMLGFKKPVELDFDAALIKHTDISWISVNSSKPGRPQDFTLLVHSTNLWAEHHLDMTTDSVKQHLIEEFKNITHQDISAADHINLHRWLYANINRQKGALALVDHEHRLAAIGDWCISGRVESAFTSGLELDIHAPII